MAILIDTGALFAIADRADDHHEAACSVLAEIHEPLIVPAPVVVEAAYLLQKVLGVLAERRLVQSIIAGEMRMAPLTKDDLRRIDALLGQYAEARIGFVDASVVAIAERLGITRLLTTDHRHFAMIRPRHCSAFELLL